VAGKVVVHRCCIHTLYLVFENAGVNVLLRLLFQSVY